jgi:hypothetical protein
MLRELEDYGWQLARDYPFEYSAKWEHMWARLKHTAFPQMHVCISVGFMDEDIIEISVSDDNCDQAGDSRDVLIQSRRTFDPAAIWAACEQVMESREQWSDL